MDAIPDGYLTLGEALQQAAKKVSDADADLEAARLEEAFAAANARCMARAKEAGIAWNELVQQESGFAFDEEQRVEDEKHGALARSALFPPAADKGFSRNLWLKRELAIRRLRLALQDEMLVAYVRDPDTGARFRLTAGDWRGADEWRAIIISGQVVRAHVGEAIGRHAGRTVLLEAAKFEKWLKHKTVLEKRAIKKDWRSWLEDAMRASPGGTNKSKNEWFREVQAKFDATLSRRKFNEAWSALIEKTGAHWDSPGAKKKSAQ